MNLSWLGLEIEEARIERILGEGGFSVVYQAVASGKELAFKVARTEVRTGIEPQTGCFNTLALAPVSSGIAEIAPQPNQVLSCQYAGLKALDAPGIIKPLSANEVSGIFYYQMPVLSGPSMRKEMREKRAEIAQLQDIARICAVAARQDTYHGDLKPENIILTDEGPVLIDPGYFGPLVVSGVRVQQCLITTPSYYPLYCPDDLLALGIMLWEMVLGKQPFSSNSFSGDSDLDHCGTRLIEFVQDQEKVGRYAYSPVLDLKAPAEIRSGINSRQEECLLKGLRLERSSSGKLDIGEGFGSFSEFADAIEMLKDIGKA